MNSDNFSVTAINHKPHRRPRRPSEGAPFLSCMVSLLTNKRSSWTPAVLAGIWHSYHPHSFPFLSRSVIQEYCTLLHLLFGKHMKAPEMRRTGIWAESKETGKKKRVPEYLLSKLRGGLLLASPSLAFTSLTAPLASFDIPSLCSATLQIPLSHLHSLKAQFHLSPSLSFFPIPFSFCYFK